MRQQVRLRAGATHSAGMTLVELMVSMVLGLIVIGGVVSIVVANKASYRTNEGLSQIQESARTAFELMARDIRQAGINGCSNNNRVANVLVAPTPLWWQNWFVIAGYESGQTDPAVATGTAPEERFAGTDSIQLQGIEGTGLSVETHEPVAANFKINTTTLEFTDDDILMVCDFDHAAIFRVSNYNSSNVTVGHNEGSGVPRNCNKGLGYPTDCVSPNGNLYAFGPNSLIARFVAVDWYIGNNGRPAEGGLSLYRRRMQDAPVEIVAGVTNMDISYRVEGANDFVAANLVTAANWGRVNAVRIELTMDSADRNVSSDASVNSGRLQRRFTNIVALRNRLP